MAWKTGSVTVTAVDDITGEGMAFTLFESRKVNVDAALDAADAAAADQPRQPDPEKVRTFIQANLAVNGPLVAGYAQAANWPEELLTDPPDPIDRLEVYRGLAAQCEVDAEGVLADLKEFTTSVSVAAGATIATPAFAHRALPVKFPNIIGGGDDTYYLLLYKASGGG